MSITYIVTYTFEHYFLKENVFDDMRKQPYERWYTHKNKMKQNPREGQLFQNAPHLDI